MKQHKAEKRFADLNSAMQQYFLVTGRQLEPLPPKPVLSDFYVPSEDHHNCELVFIALPGTESMGKPWKNHGKSMGKIPWIPLKTMEHGAGAKFHGFHGEIPMLSMLAWDSKNCKITPHESMESME